MQDLAFCYNIKHKMFNIRVKSAFLLLLLIVVFLFNITNNKNVLAAADPASLGNTQNSKTVGALEALFEGFGPDGAFVNSGTPDRGCAFVGADLLACIVNGGDLGDNEDIPIVLYYFNLTKTYEYWTVHEKDPKNPPKIVFTAIKAITADINTSDLPGYFKAAQTVGGIIASGPVGYVTGSKVGEIGENLLSMAFRSNYKDVSDSVFQGLINGKEDIIIDTQKDLTSGTFNDSGEADQTIYFTNLGNANSHPGGDGSGGQCNLMEYTKSKGGDTCDDIGAGEESKIIPTNNDFAQSLAVYTSNLKNISDVKCGGSGSTDKISSPFESYILCPLISAGRDIIGAFITNKNSILVMLLEFKPIQITELDSDGKPIIVEVEELNSSGDVVRTHNVTQKTALGDLMLNLQNLAYVFYAIVFVVALILNIFGLETYNIKKILPRLVMAVIATFVSVFIMQAAVDITNVLGKNLPGELYSIASSDSDTCKPNTSTNNNGTNNESTELSSDKVVDCLVTRSGGAWDFSLTKIKSTFLLIGVDSVIGIGLILVTLLTLILVIVVTIMAVVALSVRQFIIFVCILLAPIAFTLSVLPNTQNLYKKWYSTLFNNLALFPIITGLITLSMIIQATILKG